ncbi:SLATT domain-containing protein [Sphaerisporangium aureirubrum]|uniref:SLATT domain-containing protein n=1 Tax=Sphaerisporangium aureirubrum TaxID=1544736 RepID=A0ABW1NNS2_9ACTN
MSGVPAEEASPAPDPRPRRRWGRGDLPPLPRPGTGAQEWADPLRALEELREWAEGRALELIDWYARDKRIRRVASRGLRAGAVVLAVAGGVAPLVLHEGAGANLGYVFLAMAAGCVAFDHFFGISSGWMRDIAALMSLRGRLTRFHLDWAAWQADPSAPERTAKGLALIDRLVSDIVRVSESETAQWIAEFNTSVASLRQQSTPAVTSTSDLMTWSHKGDLST